jgi:hypothetical protein
MLDAMGEPRSLVVALCLAMAAASPAAGQKYIDGVFVATRRGPVELIAHAELTSRGQLRMQQGSLDDAPVVDELVGILCSLPLWRPNAIVLATSTIFSSDKAERRVLSFSGRKLNVYASELRVVDLERRSKIDSLLKSVKASAAAPGYGFVVVTTHDGMAPRYYPFRLTPEP